MNVAAITSASAPAETTVPSRPADRTPAAERKKAAAQFEAILVRQLLNKSLTSMLGTENDTASSVYGDMLTDTLAKQLTAGPGLGLGRMIETQLTPRSTPAVHPIKP